MPTSEKATEDKIEKKTRRCSVTCVLLALLIVAVLTLIVAVVWMQNEIKCLKTTISETKSQGASSERHAEKPGQVQLRVNGQSEMKEETQSILLRTKRRKTLGSRKCEVLTIPMCTDLPYNMTMFPSLRHRTQEEAALEAHQFFPLVKVQCSAEITLFLCSVYAPPCNKPRQPMMPCRELCNRVSNGCLELMERFGFPWPESMACDKFPDRRNGSSCINGTVDLQASISSPSADTCEPVTIPLCQNMPYRQARFPNALYRTQEDAALAIHQFTPLVNTDCSPVLKTFLCSVYAPPCSGSQFPTPPCKELCKRATKKCEILLKRFGISLPAELRCKRFPRKRESNCFEGPQPLAVSGKCEVVTIPIPLLQNSKSLEMRSSKYTLSGQAWERFIWATVFLGFYRLRRCQDNCEKVKIPLCKGLDYNMTMFPNHFNHRTQVEAALEVHQFYPLVKSGCSNNLRFLLCSVYAPICTVLSMSVPPCRELCEQAKKDCLPILSKHGFSWPSQLSCEQFPNYGTEICVTDQPSTPTPTTAVPSDNCEEVTIPMCKGLDYNMAMFPNFFNHQTQVEAALEVHQFYPLVKSGCSNNFRFFVCSVYAPVCTVLSRSVPPCRELCEQVKKDCLPIMSKNGFSWPSQLSCEQFPNLGTETCVDDQSLTPSPTTAVPSASCQSLTLPVCRGLKSNFTRFPNLLGHNNQAQAGAGLKQFDPLLKANCSPVLPHFLCSVYAPTCRGTKPPLQPCREVCETARKDCKRVIKKAGFNWPPELRCKRFPRRRKQLCESEPPTTPSTAILTTGP